jgi:hypothetical protein
VKFVIMFKTQLFILILLLFSLSGLANSKIDREFVLKSPIVPDSICDENALVFLTFQDYLNNNYTDSFCLDFPKNSIRTGSFNRLIVKTKGVKKVYAQGKVFLFSKGETKYRYYAEQGAFKSFGYFKIIEYDGITFYSKKGTRSNTHYYYSLGLNTPIMYLSMTNLKKDIDDDEFLNEIKNLVEPIINYGLNKAVNNMKEINEIYKSHFYQ